MDSSFGQQLLTTLLALGFVIALAGGSLWMLKRWQTRTGRSPGGLPSEDLRFLRALPLGAKERVVLMSYRGEEWLLGVTAGQITLLGRHASVPAPGDGEGDRA